VWYGPDMPSEPSRRYLTPTGKTLAWITKIHRGLFQLTGGAVGSVVPNRSEPGSRWPVRAMRILLLTTRGRKSGLARTVPLPYFVYDDRILLVASFAGGDAHPAWLLNLRDQPEVEVQLGRRVQRARAEELVGADRDQLWLRLTSDWPRYAVYQRGTKRTIPLVELVLEPT
jgi:F420H(2)-dependent quinone reductase